MFPNYIEFFARERIAERYAEAEQSRLGQGLAGQGALQLRRRLGRVVYRLGCQLIAWSELLRYPEQIPVADQTDPLTP